ncbi:unnamed protein product, partial [Brassica napus]
CCRPGGGTPKPKRERALGLIRILLDSAIRAHRRAPDDVASLNPDRIEVAGDAEERPKWVSDDNSLANDGVVDPG